MFDQSPSNSEGDAGESQASISPRAARARRGDIHEQLESYATAMAGLSPADRLVWLRGALDGPIVFAHGFGIEGQVIFHWICERDLDIDVVTLDTGRLFPETYALWSETERRYGRRIRAIYPNQTALNFWSPGKASTGSTIPRKRGRPAARCARPDRSTARWPAPRLGSPAHAPTRQPCGKKPG